MLRPFHPRPGVPMRTTRPVPSLLAGRVLPRLLPVAGLLAWQLVAAQPAQARAGALDLSFGRHGMVTTDFGGDGDQANAVVVEADGKLVAAGSPGMARYNPDGSLDQSFGTGGKVTGFGASALALQGSKLTVVCWLR